MTSSLLLIRLAVLAVLATACGVPLARPADAALARDLQTLLQAQQLAGAVVATVSGPQTELLGLGVFHSGTQQPLQAEHRVQVGSIAKTVLSLAVLRLVSQGRVDLDTPLTVLLPAVRLDNPWAVRSPVRLRHLLDMSAGLPDLQLWHLLNQGHTAQQPLALALRAEAGPIQLRSEPGRQFSYSNLGHTLAAMVIEAVTGERYEAWAARELLRPLGMTRSSFEFSRQGDDPDLAWGHLDEGQPVADWPVAVRPAAHFTTTAADMARLMRFLLSEGQIDQQPFVRSDLMAGLGLAPGTANARAGLRSGYGLGLFTRDRHGAVGLCHGGSVAGWRAMFCIYRTTQQGFFIALNTDRETADYALFDGRLVQHLGVAQARPALAQGSAVRAAEPAEAAALRAADTAWSGLYVPAPGRLEALALPDRLLGFWSLDLAPGQATLREGLRPARPLSPAGPGLYRQADRQQPTLALLRDDQGHPQVGASYLTLRRVSLWQQGALWASVAIGVLGVLALLPLAAWRVRSLGLRCACARVPAAWALLVLGAALLAWGAQGWQHLAEFTPATAAVAGASLLWPCACAWQGLRAWRQRQVLKGMAWEAWTALAVLQLCGVLAFFGWLPLVPWQL